MIADPGRGIVSHDKEKFLLYWLSNRTDESGHVGTVLLMEPAPDFYKSEGQKECKLSWSIITHYLCQSKRNLIQVYISLLITSLLELILPFLTQSMVDTG